MDFELRQKWPDSIHPAPKHLAKLGKFLQLMVNRLIQGQCQHGDPSVDGQYLRRLKRELKAYERTANVEHLINAANYAYLEYVAPSLDRVYFNNNVKTVTGRYKGERQSSSS